jgi:hypothetical protein
VCVLSLTQDGWKRTDGNTWFPCCSVPSSINGNTSLTSTWSSKGSGGFCGTDDFPDLFLTQKFHLNSCWTRARNFLATATFAKNEFNLLRQMMRLVFLYSIHSKICEECSSWEINLQSRPDVAINVHWLQILFIPFLLFLEDQAIVSLVYPLTPWEKNWFTHLRLQDQMSQKAMGPRSSGFDFD